MNPEPDRDGARREWPAWTGDVPASPQPEPRYARPASDEGIPAEPPRWAPGEYAPQSPAAYAPPPAPPAYVPPQSWDAPSPPDDLTSTYPAVPPLEPVRPRGRRFGGLGGVFAVALVAALLGSGMTYGAMTLTGTAGRAPATPAPAAAASAASTPAARDAIADASATPTSAAPAVPATDVVTAAAAVRPAVVTIEVAASGGGLGQGGGSGGTGSGVIFDSNGWILTNRHVVSGGGSLTVTLADGRQFPATTYGTDTLTDLAIVKVDATGLPAAQLGDSASIQVGQTVIAIGDPLGEYPGSVTSGIVSGLNRAIQTQTGSLDDLIQTDAAINPGNSGGALVDTAGRVVGLNTAGSSGAQGINFAIPIDLAKPLVRQALAGEKLARPWLGIRYVQVTPAIAKQNSLAVTAGAWITSDQQSGPAVLAGSPAEKAGLKENDIVTAVNGAAVDASHPFIERMSSYGPGQSVTLSVRRGSETLSLKITLATRPASVQ